MPVFFLYTSFNPQKYPHPIFNWKKILQLYIWRYSWIVLNGLGIIVSLQLFLFIVLNMLYVARPPLGLSIYTTGDRPFLRYLTLPTFCLIFFRSMKFYTAVHNIFARKACLGFLILVFFFYIIRIEKIKLEPPSK